MKKLLSALLFCAALCGLSACQAEPVQNVQEPEPTVVAAAMAQEPTEPQTEKIDEMVAVMTTEEKVGQLFLARCPEEDAAQVAADYHLGGYVLFGRDFDGYTADEVRQHIRSYQEASAVPMLISTDEEGGEVVRASYYLQDEPFPSPKDAYADGGWEAVEQIERDKADLLLSLGINVNLAPVCDITTDTEQFMYLRSFSEDADMVSDFVRRVVQIDREKQLGCVLKHFPGYGNNIDTHTGIATDTRSYSEFLSADFKPFAAGISEGAGGVMVSHNVVESMDAAFPASLSDKVHQVLRRDLRFNGVIITDDLVMDAISDYTGSEAAAVLAVKAGNDMLCCSELEVQYPAVLEAVENQEIPMEQLDQSVKRILTWKMALGLIQ